MLLTAFALLMQTATLAPDGQKQAALTCANVAVRAAPGEKRIKLSGQVTYYMMLAAMDAPGTEPFLTRVQAMGAELDKYSVADDRVASTVAACDKRFPLARRIVPVELPADALERDVTCFMLLSMLEGAAEAHSESTGDTDALTKIKSALAQYDERMSDDVLKSRGMSEAPEFLRYAGARIEASLKVGNPESYALACGTAPF